MHAQVKIAMMRNKAGFTNGSVAESPRRSRVVPGYLEEIGCQFGQFAAFAFE